MDILDQYDPKMTIELLDDTDPNKFIAKMGAEAIYQLLAERRSRLSVIRAARPCKQRFKSAA